MLALHHLAIATPDPESLAGFYERVLGLERKKVLHGNDGTVRSVWLALGSALLMLERADLTAVGASDFAQKRPGYHLLALTISPGERPSWLSRLALRHQVPVVAQSDYTLYFRDPEGNRIGLSHYPDGPRP